MEVRVEKPGLSALLIRSIKYIGSKCYKLTDVYRKYNKLISSELYARNLAVYKV